MIVNYRMRIRAKFVCFGYIFAGAVCSFSKRWRICTEFETKILFRQKNVSFCLFTFCRELKSVLKFKCYLKFVVHSKFQSMMISDDFQYFFP